MIATTRHEPVISHFLHSAPALFRSPAGCLRHPFVVPGAAYAHELWDWDAYWTTLGLIELAGVAENISLLQQAISHGVGSLRNFFEHQDPDTGAVPMMMRADNPDVFACINREGIERNQAKPVFAQFALALVDADKDAGTFTAIAPLLPALDRFYSRWEQGYRHAGTGLIMWGSDVAIGVDNDPTTYARPQFSSANLLLNCLYHADLEAAAVLARRAGLDVLAMRWMRRAEEIAQAVRVHCWDERDEFFYTLDTQFADHRAKLIPWAQTGASLAWSALPMRIQMFTGFLPLWRGIATNAQAQALLRHATDATSFAAAGGIRSLSRRERMFSLKISSNPSNWNGPVWILANYLVWKGLMRYGFTDTADELATRTLKMLADDIVTNGATHEYYDPDTGAPIMNKGFISWNLLAVEMVGAGRRGMSGVSL